MDPVGLLAERRVDDLDEGVGDERSVGVWRHNVGEGYLDLLAEAGVGPASNAALVGDDLGDGGVDRRVRADVEFDGAKVRLRERTSPRWVAPRQVATPPPAAPSPWLFAGRRRRR